jgi:hypothetical protein
MPWQRLCRGTEVTARTIFLTEIDSSVKAYPVGTETQLYDGMRRLVWHHVQGDPKQVDTAAAVRAAERMFPRSGVFGDSLLGGPRT